MTTTAFHIDGYRVVQSLGVVRGVTVRSRSIIGTIGARIETIFGGNLALLTNLCERARAEAFEILLAHAQNVGANGVIGLRYDATEILPGVTEVLCYGTAVVLEPESEHSHV
ncbi:MAG TPA: YbjQ family protein [Gemmatimonadales bacterium]|nr:YbjQ family protein [Gemmatimonadales bacterium]